MTGIVIFANRQLEICYWDSDKKFASQDKMHLEHVLKRVGDVRFSQVSDLEETKVGKSDLLVCADPQVNDEAFKKWLLRLGHRLQQSNAIWTPVLILSRVDFETQADLLRNAALNNWYFDIVHPEHLDSVPIRVANLIRIHDHLKELKRYDHELSTIRSKVEHLEKELSHVRK